MNDERRCRICGSPLAAGSKFCSSCGTPVEVPSETDDVQTPLLESIEESVDSVRSEEFVDQEEFDEVVEDLTEESTANEEVANALADEEGTPNEPIDDEMPAPVPDQTPSAAEQTSQATQESPSPAPPPDPHRQYNVVPPVYPPPPSRNNNRTWWILGCIGLFIVVVCCCFVIGFAIVASADTALHDEIDKASYFLVR